MTPRRPPRTGQLRLHVKPGSHPAAGARAAAPPVAAELEPAIGGVVGYGALASTTVGELREIVGLLELLAPLVHRRVGDAIVPSSPSAAALGEVAGHHRRLRAHQARTAEDAAGWVRPPPCDEIAALVGALNSNSRHSALRSTRRTCRILVAEGYRGTPRAAKASLEALHGANLATAAVRDFEDRCVNGWGHRDPGVLATRLGAARRLSGRLAVWRDVILTGDLEQHDELHDLLEHAVTALTAPATPFPNHRIVSDTGVGRRSN